jgi:hypothetical protein
LRLSGCYCCAEASAAAATSTLLHPKVAGAKVAGAEFGQRARAWAHYPSTSEYFVFHNCDGAGIQSDCLGDIKYIERFEGYNAPGTPVICDGPDGGRNHCMFVHPASKTVFDKLNYWAGWYMFGQIDKSVCAAGGSRDWDPAVCSRILGINGGKHPYINTGAVHLFSFLLYPWVCNSDPAMRNSNFLSPTLDNTPDHPDKGWKCYADNEPLSPPSGPPGWPPQIEIYYFALYRTADGKDQLKYDKWAIADSDTPEQVATALELYPCNPGDGSNCPW